MAYPHTFGPLSGQIPLSYLDDNFTQVGKSVQSQEWTYFVTTGVGTAFVLTPSPAISAYAIGQSFNVKFHVAASVGATLAISGVATPPTLVRQNSDGSISALLATDIPSGHYSKVQLVSTTQALVLHTASNALSSVGALSITGRITGLTDLLLPSAGPLYWGDGSGLIQYTTGGAMLLVTNSVTRLSISNAGAVTTTEHKAGTTTRAAGDCYLLVDANGNFHVSAVGPAS